MSEPNPSLRLTYLDGLRGWASLMVVLSHLWGQFARHVTTVYDGPVLRAISDGHLAVLIFFVLSGAALSVRFISRPQPVRLLSLIAARYVRLIVPIAATTFIVYLLLEFQIAGSSEAGRLGHSDIFLGARHDIATTPFDFLRFSFFDVLFRYDERTTFNWSLWTMPIEFLGSLMIYGLLYVFARLPVLGRRHRLCIVTALGVLLLLVAKPLAACFCGGYALAEIIHSDAASTRRVRWAALLAFAAAAGASRLDGRGTDLIGAFVALSLVACVAFWSWPRRLFSSPLSRWLGRVSFPLYLIHVPIIACAGALFVALVEHGLSVEFATHITVLLALVACFAAATVLLPVESLSVRWSRAVGSFRRTARIDTADRGWL